MEFLREAFFRTRKDGAPGVDGHLIRFADDAVMVFKLEADARKVMEVLPKRFGKYGLSLHPTKTRLLHFRPRRDDEDPPQHDNRGFDFLGFTHFWGKSRKGFWVVQRKTASSRFSRARADPALRPPRYGRLAVS